MISDTMTSMNVLRQEAAAIGITDAEARKYGDLRHKRTWSLAIEHHLSMQDFADREALEEDPTASDSDSALSHYPTEDSKDYGIQLTANLGESGVKTDNKTASGASLQQPGMAILFEGFANGRSRISHNYHN
jgi:hypothetical protein